MSERPQAPSTPLPPAGARVVDGSVAGRPGRLRERLQRVLVTRPEREEAAADRVLLAAPTRLTRPNVVAVASPTGGVGKTALAFVLGDLLAGRGLRTAVVDADAGFGTLGALPPSGRHQARGLPALLAELDRVESATALRAYATVLASGAHVLAAHGPMDTWARDGESLGTLVAWLGRWFDLVVLDLGTGVGAPATRAAIARADHVLLVTTPERIALDAATAAADGLRSPVTAIVNRTGRRGAGDASAALARATGRPVLDVPHDPALAAMLTSGTYALAGLRGPSRLALKRVGGAVAEQLV